MDVLTAAAGDPARGLDRPHPHFDIDEAALPLAVEVLTRAVLALPDAPSRRDTA